MKVYNTPSLHINVYINKLHDAIKQKKKVKLLRPNDETRLTWKLQRHSLDRYGAWRISDVLSWFSASFGASTHFPCSSWDTERERVRRREHENERKRERGDWKSFVNPAYRVRELNLLVHFALYPSSLGVSLSQLYWQAPRLARLHLGLFWLVYENNDLAISFPLHFLIWLLKTRIVRWQNVSEVYPHSAWCKAGYQELS